MGDLSERIARDDGDAWIIPESVDDALHLDVMTPHHPGWVEGDQAPSDFDSPNPVPFLSSGGTFHVVVSWNGPKHDQAAKWTALALDLLIEALDRWGIGGKTSSGYGRLEGTNPDRNAPGGGTPETTQGVPSPVAAAPTKKAKRPAHTPARVTFLGPRPDGKAGFLVQEEGYLEGKITQGKPPEPLPDVGDHITVYIHDDAVRPQYHWDAPAAPTRSGGHGRGRGGPSSERFRRR